MKVGLIGTGFGTRVHMPAMRADEHIEVVAVCSAQEGASRGGREGVEHRLRHRRLPRARRP